MGVALDRNTLPNCDPPHAGVSPAVPRERCPSHSNKVPNVGASEDGTWFIYEMCETSEAGEETCEISFPLMIYLDAIVSSNTEPCQ